MSIAAASVVLDTNVALDLLVFFDPRVQPLQAALDNGSLQWLATQDMRNELARVLAYPRLARYLERRGLDTQQVVARFDAVAQMVEPPSASSLHCSDPDDQIFIDLALAHGALLLSKDAAVLALRKRLASRGVEVAASLGELKVRLKRAHKSMPDLLDATPAGLCRAPGWGD